MNGDSQILRLILHESITTGSCCLDALSSTGVRHFLDLGVPLLHHTLPWQIVMVVRAHFPQKAGILETCTGRPVVTITRKRCTYGCSTCRKTRYQSGCRGDTTGCLKGGGHKSSSLL
jgi:hypothetical protein